MCTFSYLVWRPTSLPNFLKCSKYTQGTQGTQGLPKNSNLLQFVRMTMGVLSPPPTTVHCWRFGSCCCWFVSCSGRLRSEACKMCSCHFSPFQLWRTASDRDRPLLARLALVLLMLICCLQWPIAIRSVQDVFVPKVMNKNKVKCTLGWQGFTKSQKYPHCTGI